MKVQKFRVRPAGESREPNGNLFPLHVEGGRKAKSNDKDRDRKLRDARRHTKKKDRVLRRRAATSFLVPGKESDGHREKPKVGGQEPKIVGKARRKTPGGKKGERE